eukprot:6310874-Amphidinium_carterae.1
MGFGYLKYKVGLVYCGVLCGHVRRGLHSIRQIRCPLFFFKLFRFSNILSILLSRVNRDCGGNNGNTVPTIMITIATPKH